jgi:t-SNARE complex subunit (syntaxin)
MTDQSLDITVSNPTVVVTPAQDNAVTIGANDATVVVFESSNNITFSPADTRTVDIYDPSMGLQYGINPNNPFVSTATCSAAVANIISVAGFCTITLRWVTTGANAYVNIYRAMSTNFAHAAKIGNSDEGAHTDAVEPGVTYTYWFEPVDYNGTTGALSLPHSTTSGNNVVGFVEALGALTASHLSPTLTALLNQIIGDSADAQAALRDGAMSSQTIYIDSQYGQLLQFVNQYKAEMDTADSYSLAQLETQSTFFTTQTTALAQQLSTLAASVDTDIATANAAITQEQTTRASEIEAVALMVTTLDSSLTTDISDANALISSEAGTRANAVEAVAGQVTQLETDFQTDLTTTQALVTQEASTRSAENLALAQTVSQLSADLTTTENSINASLSNQDTVLVTLDSAVATAQQTLVANYDTLSAGITSEAQARASETSALSGTITSHTTQLGDMSTTVTETAESVDGIEGEYGVKIDANGRVAGFGLINGPGVSAFDIVADNFSIANPDSPTVKDLYYDSATNTLKFRGQLILSNGANSTYTVSDLSDIQAQDGVDGIDGYTPVHGTDYFDGVPGLDGSDGDSAYQSWVDEGNTGTTVDFLNVLVGQDGENGSDGLPGTPGTDGITHYTWIKYADSADGTTGFSNVPTGKDYIGFVFNQPTSTESTNPVEYTWSLIKGTAGLDGTNGIDGTNGVDGADGTPSYFHIAYGTSSAGDNFSQSPTGKTYVGTYVDSTQTDSANPTDYIWSLFTGADGINGLNGSDGIAGTNGADGLTSYFHVAYGTSLTGAGFSQSPAGKNFIGTYVDTTLADSSIPSHYTWAAYVGANGTNGNDGSDGTNGSDGNNGTNGSNGTSGAGFYRYGTSNGAWPSTSTANSYLLSAAGRVVVQDDVLTIYKTTDPTVSSTRRYTGSAWVTSVLLIDGDMIATGTIAGDRIVANSLTVDTAQITGDLAADRITTGTGSSRIEISNTNIKVYNNGTLRVKIGLL